MRGLQTIRNADLALTVKQCETDQKPLIFWDTKEVRGTPGIPLPTLKGIEGWNVQHAYKVDLDDAEQVTKTRLDIMNWIEMYNTSKEEVGFAIVGRTGNILVILVYATN